MWTFDRLWQEDQHRTDPVNILDIGSAYHHFYVINPKSFSIIQMLFHSRTVYCIFHQNALARQHKKDRCFFSAHKKEHIILFIYFIFFNIHIYIIYT